jgi:hypothetical protein
MARQNGPFGPSGTRPPLRRPPAEDAFASPPAYQNGQWPPRDYPDPSQAGQGFHFPPPEPDPNYPHHQQQWGQQPGAQGYDLGNYMPSGNQHQHYPAHDQAHYQQGQYPAEYDQGYAENESGYGDYEEEDEEPRRGRRWIFVAAALIGAIGLGGALAYTYKSVIAPSASRVPLVKAHDANVKVRPDNRKTARVNDESAPPARPAAAPDSQDTPADDSGGPRRVRTIPIVPGGPPAAAETSPPQGVPGITLDLPRPAPQAQPPAAPPGRVVIGQPPPAASEPPPSPMVRRPAAPPPVVVTPPAEPPVVARPAPAPKAPAPPPARTKEPAPPPAVVATTGAGYVAVLSSQKTRVGALSVFADLQQKYRDVLQDKTPDVQEADLSARGLGTMYRLVVGPPGSRDAASGVCSQLKTAGYQGCWVTAY